MDQVEKRFFEIKDDLNKADDVTALLVIAEQIQRLADRLGSTLPMDEFIGCHVAGFGDEIDIGLLD